MTRPTFAAIVTAHADTPFGMVRCLENQTVKPDQILVGVSDWWMDWPNAYSTELLIHRESGLDVLLRRYPNRNDFGYEKRNKLLELVTSDYVGFFCHDDSYDPTYLEKMLDMVGIGNQIVYCNWADFPTKLLVDATFNAASTTLGSFIVDTELIKMLGGFRTEGLADQLFDEQPEGMHLDTTLRLRHIYEQQVAHMAKVKEEGGRLSQLLDNDTLHQPAVAYMDGVLIEQLRDAAIGVAKVPEVLYFHNKPYWSSITPTMFGEPI